MTAEAVRRDAYTNEMLYIDPGTATDDAADNGELGTPPRENRGTEGYRPDELGT